METLTYKGVEIPANDADRVQAVDAYGILDTPPEQEYDDVTVLAAQITGCPVSYISIFDKTRSWLKSSYGLPPNRPPRPREQSMCAPTICQRDMMVVPDLRQNPRYASLPAVVNPPHARFYCGVPLINRDAYALGTLCVWSPEETHLNDGQLEAMKRLAQMTMVALERRRDVLEMKAKWEEADGQTARGRAAVARAEQVAYRLLPQAAAARMLAGADVPARVHKDVTVVCLRMKGLDVEVAADVLHRLGSVLDSVVAQAGMERIGFVGDAYYAVVGIREAGTPNTNQAEQACAALLAAAQELAMEDKRGWTVSSGMASGQLLVALTGQERISISHWGHALVEARDNARGG